MEPCERRGAVKPFVKVLDLVLFYGGRVIHHYHHFFFPGSKKEPQRGVSAHSS